MNMIRWMAGVAAAALLLAAGCGGGIDRTKAQVRLVNASSGYAQLDYRVDDKARQTGIAYGQTASYTDSDPGKVNTIFASGSPTALLTFSPGLSANKYYTLLAYGVQGALKQVMLDENVGAPDANNTLLRVLNAAPDAGSLDVYITGANDTLQASVPALSGASVDAVSSFITVTSGTWRLRVTAASSKTDVRLDVSSVTLASRQVAALVLTPGAGGVLVQGLLLSQQGAVTPQAATQARVRVATGLTNVNVRLGSTTLLSELNSAAVTAYSVLPSGAQTLVVTVGGAPLASSVQTLTPGADYTLLVHGTTASPLVSLIGDDNTLPLDRSQAKLRLVNGVGGLTGTLSLTVDALPVAVGVAAGTASAYASQDPSSTARLNVAASGVADPLYNPGVDQTFLAASNYSVFVLGAYVAGTPGSTTGVLRKDR